MRPGVLSLAADLCPEITSQYERSAHDPLRTVPPSYCHVLFLVSHIPLSRKVASEKVVAVGRKFKLKGIEAGLIREYRAVFVVPKLGASVYGRSEPGNVYPRQSLSVENPVVSLSSTCPGHGCRRSPTFFLVLGLRLKIDWPPALQRREPRGRCEKARF